MGFYLNGELPVMGKAAALINYSRARRLTIPEFNSAYDGSFNVEKYHAQREVVVIVLQNGLFDAAGLAYSNTEFGELMNPDGRHKEVLIMSYDEAKLLMDYDPYKM